MKVFVVVEGQGEVAALPILLRRLALARSLKLDFEGRPWRESRGRLVSRDAFLSLLQVARMRADCALVLLDADDDCAVELGRSLRTLAAEGASGFPVFVVAAVREFEAWFLAAAESLRGQRGLPLDLARPDDPERVRNAKGWLSERMKTRYSPTLDQPALAALFDLSEAELWSRSFRKLVSDVTAIGSR